MSALNSKIRGKKIVFSSEDDENLISMALSIIWEKTDKKVESCHFDKDKVRICFKNNEGRIYFDLQDKTFENDNPNISIQLEHYKSLCEKYKSKCADLQNELQKCPIPGTVDITDVETSKSRVIVPASQVPAADVVVLIESRPSVELRFQPSSSSLQPSKISSESQPPTVSSSVELPDNSKGAIDETLGISKGKKKEIMEDREKDRETSEDSKSMEAKKIRIANIDIFANNNLSFAATPKNPAAAEASAEARIQQWQRQENQDINKKSPKYRSQKNYKEVENRIHKVMSDVSRMKNFLNNDLEQKINQEVNWVDDPNERKSILKNLYEHSISRKFSRSKVYSYYKRLGIWMSLYNQHFPNQEKDHYSQFYLDLKEAIVKSFSEVTKIVVKIEIFTKLFEYLPSGSWAVCDIPVTFYNLIYRECWVDIFDSIENNTKFPYEKYFENEVLESMFGELSLNQNQKKNDDESEDENENLDEEEEEEEECEL